VAVVDSLPPHNRIPLPPDITPGRLWFPTLGACDVDPLPGGWLVRLAPDLPDAPGEIARATLDLRNADAPSLRMNGQFGCWRRDLSLRHAEILLALAVFPEGRSAPELAGDLYGDQSRVVTVRAEFSRLRKQYVGLLAAQPYRIAKSVDIEVQYPEDMTALLPSSTAPFVRAARANQGS
jgi:hypothetical protein